MRLSFAFAWLLSLLLGLFAPAAAAAPKTDEGVPVKVVVLDSERKPIPTAVIRH
ncbi:MAG: hypothetical protein FJ090_22110, partial [Deltaproteobacteria bacterium]|nr:hypothetical protein [Deltaproteobacteria bacterium]